MAPSAFTWVRGYPNVLYGINQCYAGTSPSTSPRLPLPMRAGLDPAPPDRRDRLFRPDVAGHLRRYLRPVAAPERHKAAVQVAGHARDTGLDRLRRSRAAAGRHAGRDGEHPLGRRPGRPPGLAAWSIYASNIYTDGRTAPWGGTLWFVPPPGRRRRPRPSERRPERSARGGRLLLHDNYGWPELGQHYWLDTASFGVEFGPPSGVPTGRRPVALLRADLRLLSRRRMTLLTASCAGRA